MFYLLGLALSLAVLFLLIAVGTLVNTAVFRFASARLRRIDRSRLPGLLFLIHLAPLFVAFGIVLGFVVPAFVELEPGLEGLIHVSELSNQRVRNVTDVVKPGDTVQVRVLEIDKEARRISLSMKRAAETAPATAAAPQALQAKKKRPQLRGGLDF